MKKRLYIKTALSLMTVALLSSCLKEGKYAVDFQGAKPMVELPSAANVGGSGGTFQVIGLGVSAAPVPFNIAVNLAAPKTLGSALTVKLSVDNAALTAYNNAHNTQYQLLPTSDYTSTLTATIPAGQNLANVVVNVNTSVIDLTIPYVLPLTITDAGGQQISNYKTILFNITVKNAFDDNYTETGYKFHTTATASHAFTGNTVAVSTVNAVTSQTAVGDLGGSGYFFNFDTNGSAVSNWAVPSGAATPAPPASGFMTGDYPNPGGASYITTDGAQPGTAPYVSATYNNSYDAGSKTYFMHYGYGVGTTGQADYSRVFYIKLVGQ